MAINTRTKYGDSEYYYFLYDKYDLDITLYNKDGIMGCVKNVYYAQLIIDALMNVSKYTLDDKPKFTLKQVSLLKFIESTAPEPYSTRATNALMWFDQEEYKKLLSEMAVIYS